MSVLFGCGHANPPGNRYCNVCGASRNLPCASCGATNRNDAAFCGNCGIRLPRDGAGRESAEPTRIPGAGDAPERAPSAKPLRAQGSGGAGPLAAAGAGRVYGDPDDFIEDEEEEEERERRNHRRRRATMAVFVIAILLVVGALALGRFAGILGKTAARPGRGAIAEQKIAPAEQRASSTDAERVVTAPSAPARAEPPPADPRVTANKSVENRSSAEPPRPQLRPTPMAEPPAPPPPSAHTSEAPAAANAAAEAPVTLPPPPTRGRNAGDPPDQAAAPAPAPPPAGGAEMSSEERVAGFLVGELGPARAEQQALANAEWYGRDREEYGYWQRVAQLIKQGEGR